MTVLAAVITSTIITLAAELTSAVANQTEQYESAGMEVLLEVAVIYYFCSIITNNRSSAAVLKAVPAIVLVLTANRSESGNNKNITDNCRKLCSEKINMQ